MGRVCVVYGLVEYSRWDFMTVGPADDVISLFCEAAAGTSKMACMIK